MFIVKGGTLVCNVRHKFDHVPTRHGGPAIALSPSAGPGGALVLPTSSLVTKISPRLTLDLMRLLVRECSVETFFVPF